MKIVIKYETEKVTFNLSDEEAKQMGDCVNIDLDAVPEDERQAVLQEACDESLNKPDYNNWHQYWRHQYWRHQGESRAAVDEEGEELDSDEPLMKEVADDRIFRQDEIKCEQSESDEAICQWIRKVLHKKPEVAEAFIATKYGDTTIREYASSLLGADATEVKITKLENSLSKKLARAAKVLAEAYMDRDF
jgi:hypothetical protein